jgi:hypothetical protein
VEVPSAESEEAIRVQVEKALTLFKLIIALLRHKTNKAFAPLTFRPTRVTTQKTCAIGATHGDTNGMVYKLFIKR